MIANPRVAVIQDGARLHYAIPLAFQRVGILDRVFCDWFSSPGSFMYVTASLIKILGPSIGQRMLDRWEAELDASKIISNPILALRMARIRNRIGITPEGEARISNWVTRWVNSEGFGNANVLFGFIRMVEPALYRHAREQGIFTIGDQIIAPFAIELAEERKQREMYPEYVEASAAAVDESWIDLEKQTWAELDHITCASAYVRDGLIAQGITPAKITVNPYPVDTDQFPLVSRKRSGNEPITIGFIGAVNLRKGTPCFFEVARRFDPAKVRFVMVGPIGISNAAAQKFRGNVELAGPVPRSEIAQWLSRFDVFFFPSTCEGSAGAVSEAMSSGLPIVTSPNSGSVVEHARSGFIHSYEDVEGFVKSLKSLVDDADLRRRMGSAARTQMEELGIDRYAQVLGSLLNDAVVSQPGQ